MQIRFSVCRFTFMQAREECTYNCVTDTKTKIDYVTYSY